MGPAAVNGFKRLYYGLFFDERFAVTILAIRSGAWVRQRILPARHSRPVSPRLSRPALLLTHLTPYEKTDFSIRCPG